MKARQVLKDDPEVVLADQRYEQINSLLQTVMKKRAVKWSLSEFLDKVFLDKYLGIPIFLVLMWATFEFSFTVSAPFMGIVEEIFAWLAGFVEYIPNEWFAALIGDGIIGGLGFLLVFVPPIFAVFFALSLLEDSGYLARACFVMDRLMYSLGLHGRSFIPMILGFGCNIPGIMAARSIEGEKDRLMTILVNPYISCGARLPVYVLIAGAFFPDNAGTVIFSMYILGIIVAILSALVYRKTILPGDPAPFILELPLYKIPTFHGTVIHMWDRGRWFIQKAGTTLLGGAVALWFLSAHPWGAEVEATYAGQLGHLLAPIFAPLGFDWRIATSLFFAFLAKEIVVEALGVIYAVEGEAAIGAALQASLSPVSALALMVFTLLYMPCLAAVGAIKSETGSWKWTAFSIVSTTVVAYAVSLLVVVVGGILV